MPQTEEARSKPLVGNARALDLGLIGCSGIPEQARVGGARPDVRPVQRKAGIPERERTGGSSERLNTRISVI